MSAENFLTLYKSSVDLHPSIPVGDEKYSIVLWRDLPVVEIQSCVDRTKAVTGVRQSSTILNTFSEPLNRFIVKTGRTGWNC